MNGIMMQGNVVSFHCAPHLADRLGMVLTGEWLAVTLDDVATLPDRVEALREDDKRILMKAADGGGDAEEVARATAREIACSDLMRLVLIFIRWQHTLCSRCRAPYPSSWAPFSGSGVCHC